ncbi:hypothetical protein GGR08_000010 [Bartonella fuyuanensis]|uniref:Uncharacterized protein n=1 Tax=Bartonella fuyuanensis TaxID=1460968 RepID=A0A840E1S5_9HYPH|nr:hypothetical protein [Bartonella fuyuanensis]MBB4075729.1 hypothetical protein [Bartonella fuyuanensis]
MYQEILSNSHAGKYGKYLLSTNGHLIEREKKIQGKLSYKRFETLENFPEEITIL